MQSYIFDSLGIPGLLPQVNRSIVNAAASAEEDFEVSNAADPQGSVLVIDDEAVVRKSLISALRYLNYEVIEADCGEAGLSLAIDHQPDVIISDISMPGMDGFELCQWLKSDPETRLIPIVFLTGDKGREARLEGLEAGASDFLTKPCDFVELEARVRNLVAFRRLTQDLDSAEEMFFAIAKIVEARDPCTGDHCERLAGLAVRLGAYLGLDEEDLVTLKRGAYLHDVGKIAIPDEVLLKPGPLTAEEWEIMRSHVDHGSRICSQLLTFRPVKPIIRHHHEKYNGSGYPDGLKGEEIPYLARVFQVVDVYDALTNDRVYRTAMSMDSALDILADEVERGWWDPAIVAAFAHMMRMG